jgi:hypothetical protein
MGAIPFHRRLSSRGYGLGYSLGGSLYSAFGDFDESEYFVLKIECSGLGSLVLLLAVADPSQRV